MEGSLSEKHNYLDASIRTAQYLAGLTTNQDLWSETGKILVNFFGADLCAFGARGPDGNVAADYCTFSADYSGRKDLEAEMRDAVEEVLESGFLTVRTLSTPSPLSLAFLPISIENRVVAVMAAGHQMPESLPNGLLNVYLAVAGLVGTTAQRLASERELRIHRSHLEELVKERTAELTEANEQLQWEIKRRRGAEEALRLERDNLTAIFEAMQDDIYIVDAHGLIIYGNSALEKEFGPYAGRRCYEYLNDSEAPCSLCRTQDVLAGETVRWERYFPKCGKTYDVIETPMTKSNEIFKLTIFRDITERKRMEDALVESVSLLRATLDSTADGILVVDGDGKIVDFNERFALMWRIPGDVLASKSDDQALDFVLGQLIDPGAFISRVRELYQDPGAEGIDVLHFKDGRVFERYSRPQRIEDRIVGRVWSFRDVTERRLAEEKLRKSEELYSSIFNHIGVGVAMISPDMEILYLNPVMEKLNPHVDVTRRPICYKSFNVPPRTGICSYCPTIETLRDGKVHTAITDTPTEAGIVNLKIIAAPVLAADGSVSSVIEVVEDMTEHRRAETERLEMERRLLHSQKLESIGVLAGGIAHDFNNLLAVILGNLELVLMSIDTDSPVRSRINQALQATNRAASLVRQMLAYAGKGHFILREIDLNDVIRENADLFRTSVARNVTLTINAAPALPLIKADQGQVQQVIMNLIINASEAIGSNPGSITISTGVQHCDEACLSRSRTDEPTPAGMFVYLEVSDTGCGMDEETKQRIFEPFFTTKFTGRGLGMSALLGIVRSHKGAILLESEVWRGATIRVLFPTGGEMKERTRVEAAPADEIPVPAGFAGTVLVVDDEDMMRELCMTYVRRLGFSALGASDGIEATALFGECADEIRLVILDMTMPEMDGVQTFRELRRIRSDVRVIISSGFSEEDMKEQFAEEMPAGFIHKPFKLEILRYKIVSALRRNA
jgi:PAS domain S-box-containing protein